MSSPEFFQTMMGRTFFDGTMPKIARALERIAAALEKQGESPPASSEMVTISFRDIDGDIHMVPAMLGSISVPRALAGQIEALLKESHPNIRIKDVTPNAATDMEGFKEIFNGFNPYKDI